MILGIFYFLPTMAIVVTVFCVVSHCLSLLTRPTAGVCVAPLPGV